MLSIGMVSRASDITYNIDQTIGTAHAVGTVTTDGTIGTLSGGNIVGFTLTVSDSSNSNTISSPLDDAILIGNDLTATNSGLFFNFGDSSSAGFALTDPGQQNGICFVTQTGLCITNGVSIRIGVDSTYFTSSSISDIEQIATVNTPTNTPEPSSIALLGTAVLSSVGLLRKRRLA